MTASVHPPRRAETLLASLGARPDYRDAVLGDLAEEFAIRVEEQGAGPARRWYRREAVRAAPHLFANGIRTLAPRDALRLGLAAAAAGVAHRLLALAIPLGVVLAFGVRPDSIGIVAAAWRDLLVAPTALAWAGLILIRVLPVGAGFLAASLYPRGRIAAALTLAGLDAATLIYAFASASTHSVVAAAAIVPLTTIGGILLGGVLRASLSAADRDCPSRAG